ncbi:tRNA pseudouridine(38-40) synthase TruA [Austwickia chelonae]|uniref:tRNA pseudouridine(38-40) synthase TruA n=1 Tax=Austwickia chelonae TaxID=100225 RepID=UPI000E227A0D|nr:tRNA pseudouridine(38-40) synthase TruA [Austwickia chelonae]
MNVEGELQEGSFSAVRLRLDFAYDGTDFSGWAVQPGLRTVQGELSRALNTILRAEVSKLTIAGRTDAGVHARGAVAHVDIPRKSYEKLPGRSERNPAEAALTRLAGVLPTDIVIHSVKVAPPGFDARFSAIQRRYSYRIADLSSSRDPLRRHDTVFYRRELDLSRLENEARSLEGLADFAAFCKKREGATTIRHLKKYSWTRTADNVLEATVIADAFCHSMVRSLVGAVIPAAEGRKELGWAKSVLTSGERNSEVTVMPPYGLVLEEVLYPDDHELAARAQTARSVRTLPADAD